MYFRTEKKIGRNKYCDMLLFTNVNILGVVSNQRDAKNAAFEGEFSV